MIYSIKYKREANKKEAMADKKRIKVGMVQINNSFDRQNYLPLSLGFLHSYAQKHAKNFNDFEFSMPIYKRIAIDEAVEHLSGSDIVTFSTYVWNFEISKAIAENLKKKNPETTIFFGGPHIPDTKEKGLEALLRKNPFIDFASPGEGEMVFKSFLENYPEKNWREVPSLVFLDENDNFAYTPRELGIQNLNTIPSPFLEGYFDSLIKENPDEIWIGLFETNRGCPFNCRFCDWRRLVAKRGITNYDLEERIFKEIDWFSQNKIEFVYCCDANFGIFKDRDLAIAQRFARDKKRYGYPHRFSVQNTKNSTEMTYEIQKVLNDSGLDKGVLLAFQSLHEPTLEAIDRGNIKLSTYHELQKRFTSEGVTTFSDIILGLPLETYETFTNGVSTLIENGQHNRIQFNNLSMLPNTPMIDDKEKYDLQIVESDMINIHGSLGEWTDNIYERQQLVVGNNTMPKEDWVKARNFGYMIAFLHFDKVLQVPNILLNTQYGISYKEIADTFIDNPLNTPTIKEVSNIFSDQARRLQNGGAEYIHSKQWLNIWWPADEYALIKLATEGKLNAFYQEAESTLDHLLRKKGHKGYDKILSEAIYFNKELLKMPFNNKDKRINLDYNMGRIYKAGLIAKKVPIIEGEFPYIIYRTGDKWDSWEDWCREVVWWGNKKGDYIYQAYLIKKEKKNVRTVSA